MKIVDRKTFLQMPQGTVFCPMEVHNGVPYISIEEAYILDEHNSEHEYYEAKLGYMTPDDGDDFDAFEAMEKGEGRKYVPFVVDTDFSENHDSTLYAIFSANEVQSLIDQLQRALKDGYDIDPQD